MSQEAAAQGPSIEEVRKWNATKREHTLPSVVMERHHGHRAHRAHYRIEIYKSGRGYFYGLRNVRVLGEVPFVLTPEQVGTLIQRFEELGYWQLEEDLDFSRNPDVRLTYQFEVRVGNREKRIFSSGTLPFRALHIELERLVETAQWRCPLSSPDPETDACVNEQAMLKSFAEIIEREKQKRGGSK